MNSLPKNWEEKRLGESAEIVMGQSPPSKNYNTEKDGMPFFQGKAEFGKKYAVPIKWCSKPIRVAKKDDILLSVRAPVGPINIANDDCCIGRGLCAIRAKKGLDQDYLYFFMKINEKKLETKGSGSTFKAINRKEIEKIKIPLPPLPIQKQIVSILSRAEQLKEKRKQANELTAQLAQNIFLEMFGDEVPNNTIGELIEFVSSGSTPLGGQKVYSEKGITFIRSQNVLMNKLDLSDVTHISNAINDKMKRTWVKKGDVFLNITGASIGRVCYYPLNEPANVNQHVCIIRLNQKKALPEYISYYLSLPITQKNILQIQAGASRQALNFKQVKSMKIFLPTLEKQKEFVSAIKRSESILNKQSLMENEISLLFDSLMQKAFNGGLVS